MIYYIALLGLFCVKGSLSYSDQPVQYHIQTDQGGSRYFRYQTYNGQYRKEKRLQDGTVIGTYGWVDPTGLLRLYNYMADGEGYRIVGTKSKQVDQTSNPIEAPISNQISDNGINSYKPQVFQKRPIKRLKPTNAVPGVSRIVEPHFNNVKPIPGITSINSNFLKRKSFRPLPIRRKTRRKPDQRNPNLFSKSLLSQSHQPVSQNISPSSTLLLNPTPQVSSNSPPQFPTKLAKQVETSRGNIFNAQSHKNIPRGTKTFNSIKSQSTEQHRKRFRGAPISRNAITATSTPNPTPKSKTRNRGQALSDMEKSGPRTQSTNQQLFKSIQQPKIKRIPLPNSQGSLIRRNSSRIRNSISSGGRESPLFGNGNPVSSGKSFDSRSQETSVQDVDTVNGEISINFDLGNQFHLEKILPDGTKVGRHGYVDPMGILRVTSYTTAQNGHKEDRKSHWVGTRTPGQLL